MVIGTVLSLLVPVSAGAQELDANQLQASQGSVNQGVALEQLPAVYVSDVTINAANTGLDPNEVWNEIATSPSPAQATTSPNTLSGAFTISNQDNQIQGGLAYELLILDARQNYQISELTVDDPRVYYRVPLKTDLALAANSKTTVNFEHEVPPLPNAPYRARIQLATGDGRQLGWQDTPVILGGTQQAFVQLSATEIAVGSHAVGSQEPKDTWTPTEGVNVDPNQALTLKLAADPAGALITEPLVSQITVSNLLTGARLNPVRGSSITFSGTEAQTLELPLPASTEPGSYLASVVLLDAVGNTRSSIADFQYITRGATASIVKQTLDILAAHSAEVSFTLTGSADRETDVNANVEVALMKGAEVLASTDSTVLLPAGQTKTGKATVASSKALCESPGIRVTVKDAQGKVLAQRQTATSAEVDCGLTLRSPIVIGIGAVLVVIIIGAIFLVLKRRRAASSMVVGSLLLALALGFFGLGKPAAQASGIQWQTGNGAFALSLFLNKPQHQGTVAAGLGIDYEARLNYTASQATPVGANIDVYLLEEGGNVDTPNNHTWLRIGGGIADVANAQNLRTLSLTSRLPLPSGYSRTNSTIWTVATVGEGDQQKTIYDLSWITFNYGPGGPTASTELSSCLVPQVSASGGQACQQANVTVSLKNSCPVATERAPLDVFLVLDRSGSMGTNNKMTNAKIAAKTLVNQLDPSKDRVGVVSYAESARLDSPLSNNFSQVNLVLSNLTSYGWTNVAQGTSVGLSGLLSNQRQGAAKVMVVLTDGIANVRINGAGCDSYPYTSTLCTQDAITQATAAKNSGVNMFTVGFDLGGATVPRSMLQQMASSGAQFYDAPSATQLQGAYSAITQTITSTSPKVATNVVLTYLLPTGTSLVAGSASPAASSTSGQTLTWNLGQLNVGINPTISFGVAFTGAQAQQLLNGVPQSRVSYTDTKNQPQSVVMPQAVFSPNSCTATSPTATPANVECNDQIDNADPEDSLIDAADPGCHTDGNETNITSYDPSDPNEVDAICSDKKDNDGDGRVDAADPACHSDRKADNPASYQPNFTSEADTECSDAKDNVDPEDSLADINDPGCHSDKNVANASSYNPADNDEDDSHTTTVTGTPGFDPGGVKEID